MQQGQRLESGDLGPDRRVERGRRLGVGRRPGEPVEPVALVDEGIRQLAEGGEGHAQLDRAPNRLRSGGGAHALGLRPRQGLGQPPFPGGVEQQARRQGVGDGEAGIHAGLDGALA